MDKCIDIIKGIHPSKFIEREVKIQNISLDTLVKKTGIPYQRISAIITETDSLSEEELSKIESTLGIKKGFLIILQSYYEIEQAENERFANLYPRPPRIRKSLFWDADFDKINWGKYKKVVIQRVLERGSEEEIEEINNYYDLSNDEYPKSRI